jgi:hypothetical protein
LGYSAISFTAGEQPTTSKWNLVGSNDAHFYSFLGDDLAWQTWSPTYANLTPGNGVTTAGYTQVGKTILFRIRFVMGSTSSMGTAPTFTLPVTSSSNYDVQANIGLIYILDSGTDDYQGRVAWGSVTTARLLVENTSGTYNSLSAIASTVPMTWTTSDQWYATGFYEAA